MLLHVLGMCVNNVKNHLGSGSVISLRCWTAPLYEVQHVVLNRHASVTDWFAEYICKIQSRDVAHMQCKDVKQGTVVFYAQLLEQLCIAAAPVTD